MSVSINNDGSLSIVANNLVELVEGVEKGIREGFKLDVEKGVREGFKLDIDKNQGSPNQFGHIFTITMFPNKVSDIEQPVTPKELNQPDVIYNVPEVIDSVKGEVSIEDEFKHVEEALVVAPPKTAGRPRKS